MTSNCEDVYCLWATLSWRKAGTELHVCITGSQGQGTQIFFTFLNLKISFTDKNFKDIGSHHSSICQTLQPQGISTRPLFLLTNVQINFFDIIPTTYSVSVLVVVLKTFKLDCWSMNFQKGYMVMWLCIFNVIGPSLFPHIIHLFNESLSYLGKCPITWTLCCHLICSFTPHFQLLVSQF